MPLESAGSFDLSESLARVGSHGSNRSHPIRGSGLVGTRGFVVIRRDGEDYRTIADAAAHFGVSAKTVRDWIRRGVLPPPPSFEYGLRSVSYFPDDYLATADDALKRRRSSGAPPASNGSGRSR